MYDLTYKNQDQIDPIALREKAKRLGLDEAAYENCMDNHVALPQIRLDAGEGVTLGLANTPTVLVGVVERQNRVKVVRRLSGGITAYELEQIVEGLFPAAGGGAR